MMFIKKIILLSLCLNFYFLHGCMSTSLLNYAKIKDIPQEKFMLTDQIQEVGQATQKFKNFEQPLVLIGQKNNYLINNQNQLDLIALNEKLSKIIITPNDDCCHGLSSATNSPKLNPNLQQSNKLPQTQNSSQLNLPLYVVYYQQENKINADEATFINSQNFLCNSNNFIQGNLFIRCKLDIGNQLSILPKDVVLPTSKLRSIPALQINAEYHKTKKEYKKAPLMILLPVTATLDVITAPFIGLYAIYLLSSMNGHPSGAPR